MNRKFRTGVEINETMGKLQFQQYLSNFYIRAGESDKLRSRINPDNLHGGENFQFYKKEKERVDEIGDLKNNAQETRDQVLKCYIEDLKNIMKRLEVMKINAKENQARLIREADHHHINIRPRKNLRINPSRMHSKFIHEKNNFTYEKNTSRINTTVGKSRTPSNLPNLKRNNPQLLISSRKKMRSHAQSGLHSQIMTTNNEKKVDLSFQKEIEKRPKTRPKLNKSVDSTSYAPKRYGALFEKRQKTPSLLERIYHH